MSMKKSIFTLTFMTFSAITPSHEKEILKKWRYESTLLFYRTQLNFAMYCATKVKTKTDIISNGLVGSIYRFHVIYHIRRVLDRLKCKLPYDNEFDKNNKPFDEKAFQTICREYEVSPNKANYYQKINVGRDNKAYGGYIKKYLHGGLPDNQRYTYRPDNTGYYADPIDQDGWWMFFAGGQKRPDLLNMSVRQYVFLILSAQSQTIKSILDETKQEHCTTICSKKLYLEPTD